MHRCTHTTARAALTAALATAVVAATAPTASAEATDLPLAVAETSLDIAQAAADAAEYNTDDPEVTCSNPTVSGSVVYPPVYRPGTVAVWGKDQAEGFGECQSLQRDSYSTTLLVRIEYRDGPDSWLPVDGCEAESTVPASDGVARPKVDPFMCPIDPTSTAAVSPRRVHGILSTTIKPRLYHGYGPVYASPQHDRLVTESGS